MIYVIACSTISLLIIKTAVSQQESYTIPINKHKVSLVDNCSGTQF